MYESQSGHTPFPFAHAQVEQKESGCIWGLEDNSEKQLLCLVDSIMIKN